MYMTARVIVYRTPRPIAQGRSAHTWIMLSEARDGDLRKHYEEYIEVKITEDEMDEAIESLKARTDTYLNPNLLSNAQTINSKREQKNTKAAD